MGAKLLFSFAQRRGASPWRARFKGEYCEARLENQPLSLLFPHTYMNHSGESVVRAVEKLGVPLENLLVLHDEVDLPFAKLRVKLGGGTGGHRGLKSLITTLGSPDFVRLRIGIGRPKGDMISWVLGPFTPEEERLWPELYEKSTAAIEAILRKGASCAMNAFNGAKKQ